MLLVATLLCLFLSSVLLPWRQRSVAHPGAPASSLPTYNTLGHYTGIGMEDPETPHQFPLQSPNPPTAPTPIEANTFVHIPDSPPHSPSPFQFPPQEVITWTLEEHPMEEHSHLTPGSAPMSRTSPTDSGEILHFPHLHLHPPLLLLTSDHHIPLTALTQMTSNHSYSNVS